MRTVDVAIVGGGPAGSAAALTLARYSSLETVLIERGDYSELRVGETVGPGVMPLLNFLGVADRITEHEHQRGHSTAAAWGSSDIFSQEFLFSGQGQGWHFDRNRFDAMLAESARQAGATVSTQTRVREIVREDGLWRISTESDHTPPMPLAARFLIDASGRAAFVARKLGAEREVVDRLVGIVGYIQFDTTCDRDGSTFVESTPEGWWYSTWLPEDTLAVAFMSDADLIRSIDAHSREGWTKLLSETIHMRERVVGGRRPLKLFTRNAASHLLRPAGADGWLAAGDALSAFDPLSSMGIGHSLASGAHAARAVEASLRGDFEPFAEYLSKSAEHFAEFLTLRSRYYRLEQRWLSMPFWQRRLS